MEFVLALAMALVAKVVDVNKMIRDGDWYGVISQVTAWGVSVGVVLLLSASAFGGGVVVAGVTLATLDLATKILLGLSLGSSMSLVKDVLKLPLQLKKPAEATPPDDLRSTIDPHVIDSHGRH